MYKAGVSQVCWATKKKTALAMICLEAQNGLAHLNAHSFDDESSHLGMGK